MPKKGAGASTKRADTATIIDVYARTELGLGTPIILLASRSGALLVWVVAGALLFLVNIAACGWAQRHWDLWMSGSRAARFDARLQQWGKGRRRLVEGIAGGSVAWMIADLVSNAITSVSLARLVSGAPVSGRKVVAAVATFAVLFSGLGSLCGWVLSEIF